MLPGHEGKGKIPQPRRFAARDDVFGWLRVVPAKILHLSKGLFNKARELPYKNIKILAGC